MSKNARYVIVSLLAVGGCGAPEGPGTVGVAQGAGRVEKGEGGLEVVAPGKPYAGVSQADWGFRWWQWVMTFNFASNPVTDPTGALCGQKQQGPVWFLAGDFGGKMERSCTVPEDKALLVPIYNLFDDYPCPDPSFKPAKGQSLEDFLTKDALSLLGTPSLLDLAIDGRSVPHPEDYLAVSRLGKFTADLSWLASDPCVTGKEQEAVSAGWYMILKPGEGRHDLRIRAEGSGGFSLDVTYHLNLKD